MGTNPCTATRISLVSYLSANPSLSDIRHIYLNGISIEIVSQNSSGVIQVEIKFDNVNINNDVRWCGDDIVLNPIPNSSIYSLNLITGKTLTLDQGTTATRMKNPITYNSKKIFVSPTVMHCVSSTKMHLESNSTIVIDNGSTLELKDFSQVDLDAGAKIIVKHGGKLILNPNSTLNLQNTARIVIEQDGQLDYFPDAIINLNGLNAVLEIAGQLKLENNAVFTYTYTTNNHGFVLLDSPTSPSKNIIAGTNCSIFFHGANTSRKVLEVEQEMLYSPAQLSLFKIDKGVVSLHSYSGILIDGPTTQIYLKQARITSDNSQPNFHRGLNIYGQLNTTIDQCVFENGQYGIFAYLKYWPIRIWNSTFSRNLYGIFSYNKGVSLMQSNFIDNTYGYYGWLPSLPSEINDGISISNNINGVMWRGYSTASLNLNDPYLYQNYVGAYVYRAPLYVNCGLIGSNSTGIYAGPFSSVFMDNNPGTGLATTVTLTNNTTTIQAYYAQNLFFNRGNNDFTSINIGGQADINGTMMSGGLNPINMNENKWNNSGSLTNSDYSLNDASGNPISLIDNAPLSSAVQCGQAIPPCNPPCNNLLDATEYCPSCDLINTEDFINKRLNEATNIALDKYNSTDVNKYRDAINYFAQILLEDYINPDNKEKYLLILNYIKMMESIGNAYKYSQLEETNNEGAYPSEILVAIQVQNKLIDQAIQQGDYKKKLAYSLDEAQTKRITGHLNDCLNLLEDIKTWTESDDLDEVNGFICAINLEIDVLQNNIKTEDIEQRLSTCITVPNERIRNPHLNQTETTTENQPLINLFPNPTHDVLFIQSTVKNGRVEILNSFGQTVYKTDFNYTKQIDIDKYSRGLYMIRISDSYKSLKIEHIVFN